MTPPVDLTALRKAAEKATPGPWVTGGTDESGNTYVGGYCHDCAPPCGALDAQVASAGTDDAVFIAAASPDVILALLDHIAAVEQERASNADLTSYLEDEVRALRGVVAAAEARLAKVQALADGIEIESRIDSVYSEIQRDHARRIREALGGTQ